MCLCTWVRCPGGLKPVTPLELELQVVVSRLTWLLGLTSGPLLEQRALLTTEPSLWPLPYPAVNPSIGCACFSWFIFSVLVSICLCFNLISFWQFPFLWWGFLFFMCSKGVYGCSLKHFSNALAAAPPTLFSLSLWLDVSRVPTGRLELHVWNVLLRTKQHK